MGWGLFKLAVIMIVCSDIELSYILSFRCDPRRGLLQQTINTLFCTFYYSSLFQPPLYYPLSLLSPLSTIYYLLSLLSIISSLYYPLSLLSTPSTISSLSTIPSLYYLLPLLSPLSTIPSLSTLYYPLPLLSTPSTIPSLYYPLSLLSLLSTISTISSIYYLHPLLSPYLYSSLYPPSTVYYSLYYLLSPPLSTLVIFPRTDDKRQLLVNFQNAHNNLSVLLTNNFRFYEKYPVISLIS